MFTVKKIPKTPNILWDAAAKTPLCKFVNGVLETNDAVLADKLKGMGYEVTGETDVPEGAEASADTSDKEKQLEGAEAETPKTSAEGKKRAAK